MVTALAQRLGKALVRACRVALRAAVTLALLYVTSALLWAMTDLPIRLDRAGAGWPVALGFCGGVLLFTFVARLSLVYVFGHELTHWLAAKLFRRRTAGLRVGRDGGSIGVERPNIWIILAPYFVPVYTLVWVGFYGAYCFYVRPDVPGPVAMRVVFAGVGLTYSFHVVSTVHALRRGQSDLQIHGATVSLAVVLFCNALLVYVALLAAARQWLAGGLLAWRRLQIQWELLSTACRVLASFLASLGR